MKSLALGATFSVSITTALLVGCGGLQTPFGAMPQSGTTAAVIHHSGSWMLPEAKSEDLLYVGLLGFIRVYSYPEGKLVGTIKGSEGRTLDEIGYLCVNKAGDVFVPDYGGGYAKIYEYAHGARKPKGFLEEPGYAPYGCAVDPTTGNLAVTNATPGNVAVYPDAQGSPTIYTDPEIGRPFFCGYDDSGNLYIDGTPGWGSGFQLAELPKGASAFTNITVNQTLSFPGAIQWHDNYLVVSEQTTTIYQFAISGSKGVLDGTTTFGTAEYPGQFWIDGSTVVTTNKYYIGYNPYSDALFYDYPGGGSPTKTIKRGFVNVGATAWGVTISKASK
jgi:hypothetical protein